MSAIRFALFLSLAGGLIDSARGQSDPSNFTTIINVDSSSTLLAVASDTQVNLLDGGVLLNPLSLGAADGSGQNIEFNQLGGDLQGRLEAYAGSTANIFDTVDPIDVWVHSGGAVNVLGGALDDSVTVDAGGMLTVDRGSVGRYLAIEGEASLFGGAIGINTSVLPGGVLEAAGALMGQRLWNVGGTLNLSGGAFGDQVVSAAGTVNLTGSQFRLDGQPIQGARGNGESKPLVVPEGSVLSGLLADGTPFAFTSADGDEFGDNLTLHVTSVPTPTPGAYEPDSGLLGVRAGQVMVVTPGQTLAHSFNAGSGGMVMLTGGAIEENLELSGGSLVMTGGTLGADFDAFAGGVATISGGTVGHRFTVHNGGVASISGGAFGFNLEARSGGRLLISGGRFSDQLYVRSGSKLQLSGGSLADRVTIESGATATLTGEFQLDGEPVTGLVTVGANEALTGVLRDGTPFALAPRDGDQLGAPLMLHAATPTPIGWSTRTVTDEHAPSTLRAGQTLTVEPGGVLPRNFHASGGVLRINGGTVEQNLEAAGAHVTLAGGSIQRGADALPGSTFDIEGGWVSSGFQAFRGSEVNVTGGLVDDFFEAIGATVTIDGGEVGRWFQAAAGAEVRLLSGSIGRSPTLSQGASLLMEGGSVGAGLRATEDARLEVRGGSLGYTARVLDGATALLAGGSIGDDFDIEEGSAATISGGEFLLNGQPLGGLTSVGDELPLDLDHDDVLSGVFADGTPFLFTRGERAQRLLRRGGGPPGDPTPTTPGDNGDSFVPGSLTLRLASVPDATPGVIVVEQPTAGEPQLRGVRGGQVAVVGPDQTLPDNFNAGPGSGVTVAGGGRIGTNFEANGAAVVVTGGQIGEYADAFAHSVVTVADNARVGQYFDVRDSTVVVAGGGIDDFMTAVDNSTVIITGGEIEGGFVAYDSRVESSGGFIGSLDAHEGAVVNVSDQGHIGRVTVNESARITQGGGRINQLVLAGGEAEISGGDPHFDVQSGRVLFAGSRFLINGQDITSQMTLGVPFLVEDRGATLQTYFEDGENHHFSLQPNFGSDVVIEAMLTTLLPGDYNQDGLVNSADYQVWRSSYGSAAPTEGASADGNRDGVIDAADYTLWRDHALRPNRITAATPEPAAAVLLALSVALLLHPGARLSRRPEQATAPFRQVEPQAQERR